MIRGALAPAMADTAPAALAGWNSAASWRSPARTAGKEVGGELMRRRRAAPGRCRGRRRRDRDRRDQLHEPTGRGLGDGGADPPPPAALQAPARAALANGAAASAWCANTKAAPDRSGRRRRVVLASRRAAFQRRRRAQRRWGGGARPFGDPPRRRERGGRDPSGKIATVLRPGDRVTVETAGGGGYGDPRRRASALTAADIADGKV